MLTLCDCVCKRASLTVAPPLAAAATAGDAAAVVAGFCICEDNEDHDTG